MKRYIRSQYIPDMTERFPEGRHGIDLTDSYFPDSRSIDPYDEDSEYYDIFEPSEKYTSLYNKFYKEASRLTDEKLEDAISSFEDTSILTPGEGAEEEYAYQSAYWDVHRERHPELYEFE